MSAWVPPPDPELPAPGFRGWLRALRRGVPMVALICGGLAVLLLVRLVERPLHGPRRPWTPPITRFVCRNVFRIMGMGWHRQGAPMQGAGAVVANHSTWMDIFALNAGQCVYFVSKAEVARWPGIGGLAKAAGTLFIERDRRQAQAQTEIFQKRLEHGHRLLFFPEGTSTDNSLVISFKTTLFAAFFAQELKDDLAIQPVSVLYSPPSGARQDFYGWWGTMPFGPHLLAVLAQKQQGRVDLLYHAPLKVNAFADRKALAQRCEDIVRAGHAELRRGAE